MNLNRDVCLILCSLLTLIAQAIHFISLISLYLK